MKAVLQRFLAVLKARNKEFIRDTGSMAWNFIFPFIVIFGFAFAFKTDNQAMFKVVRLGGEQAQPALMAEFAATQYLQWVDAPREQLEEELPKLRRHAVDFIVEVPAAGSSSVRYWLNSTSPKGYLVEKLLKAALPHSTKMEKQTVTGREIRYVDWLVSGLLAMNMMFSALFGVGYVIVRYRKTGFLRRLKATPLRAFEFLFAQVVSRMWLLIAVTMIVYAGSHAVVKFAMLGSYLDLFVILLLGSVCLISIGLLVAARVRSEEFAGGLLNLVTWPMMFLSGVWFSLEGSPKWVQSVANVFPLTHVISAARAIMTEGATLSQLVPQITYLSAISVVGLVAGALIFRWE